MNRYLALLGALSVALVVTTTACAHRITGRASLGTAAATRTGATTALPSAPSSAQPTTTPSRTPSGSTDASYRTADPCSFITQNAFDRLIRHDTMQAHVAISDYGSCEISIAAVPRTGGGKPISIRPSFDMSETFTSAKQLESIEHVPFATKKVEGTTVFEGHGKDVGCIRAFQLPINATLIMTVEGTATIQCAAADAALTSALKTVRTNSVDHYKMPADSIGRVDLCQEFQHAPDAVMSGVQGRPAGVHGCLWSDGSIELSVTLTATSWPPVSIPKSAKKLTLNQRRVLSIMQSAPQGTSANAAIYFGQGEVGPKGTVDVLNVVAIEPGSGTKVKNGFADFLRSLSSSRLS